MANPLFTVTIQDSSPSSPFVQYLVTSSADANGAIQKAIAQFLLDFPASTEMEQIVVNAFTGKVL